MRAGKTRVSIATDISVLGEKVMVLTSNDTNGPRLETGWVMSSKSREFHHYETHDSYPHARAAHDRLVDKFERFGDIPPAGLEKVLDVYVKGGG